MKTSSLPIIDIKKYGGKRVGVVHGKIVAVGTDTQEIIAEATRKFPGITWRDVILISVPESLDIVYLS
jgi:Family of unknown function (DUF5678)